MKVVAQKAGNGPEQGVALVIAIFTLMLVSVIATSLIVMAGMTTALKANYKTSMQAFYDAKAGLEEGRSRLSAGHPDSISSCVFPRQDQPMPFNRACYIINPDPTSGEVVDPSNAGGSYADSEYAQEFGQAPAVVQLINSNSSAVTPGIGGPLYKWVRVSPVTERSMGISVSGTGAGLDSTNPLFFGLDGHQFIWRNSPLLPTDLSTQVLSITALSVLPSGGSSGRRLLQYTVDQNPNRLPQTFAPNSSVNLSQLKSLFPASVTMVGPNPTSSWFNDPHSGVFGMEGTDRRGSQPGACSLPSQSPVPAIGVTGNPTNMISGISPSRADSYRGSGAHPSIYDVSSTLVNDEQSVPALEGLVDRLESVATEVVQGPAVTGLPELGSVTSPVIAVVRGNANCPKCPADLTLSGSITGYGILVVTGELTLRDAAGWRGIILVIGKGILNGNNSTGNEVDGGVLIAATRDSSGNLLSNLASPLLDWKHGTSNGFFYDTCWITSMTAAFPYQVLSFREIPQQP